MTGERERGLTSTSIHDFLRTLEHLIYSSPLRHYTHDVCKCISTTSTPSSRQRQELRGLSIQEGTSSPRRRLVYGNGRMVAGSPQTSHPAAIRHPSHWANASMGPHNLLRGTLVRTRRLRGFRRHYVHAYHSMEPATLASPSEYRIRRADPGARGRRGGNGSHERSWLPGSAECL
ncbi:hypothetical protein BDV95DRAFT_37739 [Massariosphaeria phaeospora]|uniref:Uncharacterized protein n=1 Tax=Massariosphaeria phaeospora TaxID=100035 RepID=A0A7C8IG39_9PLEO|nr:hypothetical protein BDV95DRAFT_37739 [Massariosphaeria phaeospora]